MLKSVPVRVRSNAGAPASFVDRLIPLFFLTGFLFVMGGFSLQLSGADLNVGRGVGSGSLLSQAILGTYYVFALSILLRTEIGIRMLGRAWPILLLCALALISITWSTWPSLTLRRTVALLGTFVFGLSLASAFEYRSALGIVIWALVVAIVLSIVWVVVFPDFAIHHATDAFQKVHDGKWRGIFGHKNVLGGQVAGFTFALLVVYGRVAFESLVVRAGAIAVTLLCLVAADFSTGYVIALVTTLSGLVLSLVAVQPVEIRLSSLILAALLAIILSVFAQDIAGFALQALDREPDLTGRAEYWAALLQLMKGHWTFGYGYYAGGISVSGTISEVTKRVTFGATHNGYLDMLVSFGIAGSTVVFAVLLWYVVKSSQFHPDRTSGPPWAENLSHVRGRVFART